MAFVPLPPTSTHLTHRPSLHRFQMCTTVPSPAQSPPSTRFTRRVFLSALASGTASLLAAHLSTAVSASDEKSLASNSPSLQYSVIKHGNGPSPVIGDLVGIRFKGTYNGVVFDNLFNDPQPYFFRAGSGSILKGIEQAVMLMSVGDIYKLTLPPDLAFGTKGRRASAGKPSIPPNATVDYELELTTIPGKEEELLEITSDQPDL